MAILAIRGHLTRGKEIIEILKMFGAENKYNLMGSDYDSVYYVNNREIFHKKPSFVDDAICFTLEEFLVKFPYKVGDKVLYKIYNVYSSIRKMTWNEEKEQVIYRLDSKNLWVATADELTKGNIILDSEYSGAIGTTEPTHKLEVKQNTIIAHGMTQCDKVEFIGKYMLPEGTDRLEIVVNDDCEVLVEDDKAYVVRKKPTYPKTYEECCKVLNKTTYIGFDGLSLGEVELYKPFVKLMRCRDAYWKTCGWKPNWEDNTYKYVISNNKNHIVVDFRWNSNTKLSFPTEEMRDAFYTNFKKLIEECKELL